uniref:CTCHY-type domain-containing protein n=1 Tax=Brassica oleracea var. oleracea TaxID=109376 RepID=A0A0D2ZQH8_BRAOL
MVMLHLDVSRLFEIPRSRYMDASITSETASLGLLVVVSCSLVDSAMTKKLVTEMLCIRCLKVQPCGPICTTPSCDGFPMAKHYCSICKLFDDERAVYHCPFCNLCRVGEGLGIDYFHCMTSTNRPSCDTTIKRSDKASTARFRENDAVRLIDQPLQLSDRPSIPSNLQTLESITSQKALRSLMDWGGTYCRGWI